MRARRRERWRWVALVGGLCALSGACQPATPQVETRPTEPIGYALPAPTERLKSHYPELQHGPFVCVAHFNDATQPRLARVVGADGELIEGRQPAISLVRAVDATGPGGLFVELVDETETLRIDGVRSEEHALPADWSDYALLMLQVYGPTDGARLALGLESGAGATRRSWETTLRVGAGWQQQRVDLIHAAAEIDIADVRAITLRAEGIAGPVALYLDDVLLVDNAHALPSEQVWRETVGALPGVGVRVVGLRYHVLIGGRWEAVFADGVMLGLGEPMGASVVVPPGLGPWPAVGVATDEEALFSPAGAWGEVVGGSQRLLENSVQRVVIEGTWEFERDANGEVIRITWTHTIYPHGAIYVRIEGAGSGDAGVSVLLADGRLVARVAVPEAGRPGAARSWVSLLTDDDWGLLWVPHVASDVPLVVRRGGVDGRQLQVWHTAGEPAGDKATMGAMHQLRLGDARVEELSSEVIVGYRDAPEVVFARGGLFRSAEGDGDGDGFNEAEGVHELRLDRGLARFRYEPGPAGAAWPIFRVRSEAVGQFWAYADGRIIDSWWRDRNGDVMFVLPRMIDRGVEVEVLASPRVDGLRGEP